MHSTKIFVNVLASPQLNPIIFLVILKPILHTVRKLWFSHADLCIPGNLNLWKFLVISACISVSISVCKSASLSDANLYHICINLEGYKIHICTDIFHRWIVSWLCLDSRLQDVVKITYISWTGGYQFLNQMAIKKCKFKLHGTHKNECLHCRSTFPDACRTGYDLNLF